MQRRPRRDAGGSDKHDLRSTSTQRFQRSATLQQVRGTNGAGDYPAPVAVFDGRIDGLNLRIESDDGAGAIARRALKAQRCNWCK
ncbi:MAG: hypothetical protein U1F49_03315 [Rubrivivax sp.]